MNCEEPSKCVYSKARGKEIYYSEYAALYIILKVIVMQAFDYLILF